MSLIGTILWAAFSVWGMWRALRDNDAVLLIVLRGLWSLLTILLIAAGYGTAFLVANVFISSAVLLVVGLLLLVAPPPEAHPLGKTVMNTAITIAVSVLCWALS